MLAVWPVGPSGLWPMLILLGAVVIKENGNLDGSSGG